MGEVNFHINKSNPPQLAVSATGLVPTSGWNDIELSPWVYVTPPEDGIQGFDFVGVPPDGIVLQVLTPVSAAASAVMPDWLKGVRVHAASNRIEVMLDDKEREAALGEPVCAATVRAA